MDPLTLVLMIAASIVGSILGARIISRLDIMKIRVVMGVALILVAAITLCKINEVGPFGILGALLCGDMGPADRSGNYRSV